MRTFRFVPVLAALAFCASAVGFDEVPLSQWSAPPFWQRTATPPDQSGEKPQRQPLAALSTPMPFVAVTPCRVIDTRGLTPPAPPYGAPSLSPGMARELSVTGGGCGIPVGAAAVSANATVTGTGGPGYLVLGAGGQSLPYVSTLNVTAAGQTIANAAVVALSATGTVAALFQGSSADLIIDVNGYYAPQGIVNSLNSLSGNVTLAGSSTVTVLPSGNSLILGTTGVLTGIKPGTGISVSGGAPSPSVLIPPSGILADRIASGQVVKSVNGLFDGVTLAGGGGTTVSQSGQTITVLIPPSGILADRIASGQVVKSLNGLFDGVTLAGAGGATVSQFGQTITVTAPASLPTGTSGQTLRNDGSGWVASSNLTNNGSGVGVAGNLSVSNGVYGENWSTARHSAGVKGVTRAALGWNDIAGVTGITAGGTNVGSGGWIDAGVRGEGATNQFGVFGLSHYKAVVGVFEDPATGSDVAKGTLGYKAGTTAYAVYGEIGNFGGTGAKYFVEPHPTDPSKVIRYVSLEGPESGTYFRGHAATSGGIASIEVPDHFRMVSAEEGMTVHVTPVGRFAEIWVESRDLNQVVIRSAQDTEFDYIVHGVRRAFRDFNPIDVSQEFMPETPNARLSPGLPAEIRSRLVQIGIYSADGTVNMQTAERLGWVEKWCREEELRKRQAQDSQ